MQVAYDVGPAKVRPTGVGVYVRELAHALRRRSKPTLHLIGARHDGPFAGEAATAMRGERHLVWVLRDANADVRKVGADIAHFTNAVAPLRTQVPYVLTIQDLSLIRFPHHHPALRLAAVPFMTWAAHRARRVAVPSVATADELRRILRVPTTRIDVVELAPSGSAPNFAQIDVDDRLQRLGLHRGQFVLSIATIEPRKNIASLVSAFELLSKSDRDLMLVLVGAHGWHTSKIERRIEASPARARILRLGYVDDEQRAALLGGCAAFVYVSLYEGYGLPIVEAMQAGAPVVTSNISAMPEAAGGAGILVNPLNPAEIAAAVRQAVDTRESLIAAGRARADRLSWDRVATETSAVYRSALGGSL